MAWNCYFNKFDGERAKKGKKGNNERMPDAIITWNLSMMLLFELHKYCIGINKANQLALHFPPKIPASQLVSSNPENFS